MNIIKTDEEIRQFLAVSYGSSVGKLQPYLMDGKADEEMLKVVGAEMVPIIEAIYGKEDATEKQKELLRLSQSALVNLGYYYYLPFSNVSIADDGITTDRDRASFQWQYNEVQQSLLERAYLLLDKLFLFLEKNKETFSEWEESTVGDLLIKSAKQFDEYVRINESRRTFNAILPQMRMIQLMLTDGNEVTEATELKFLLPAIAHATIAEAIDSMNVEIMSNGTYQQTVQTNSANIKQKDKVDEKTVDRYIAKHKEHARMFIQKWNEIRFPDEDVDYNLDFEQNPDSGFYSAG